MLEGQHPRDGGVPQPVPYPAENLAEPVKPRNADRTKGLVGERRACGPVAGASVDGRRGDAADGGSTHAPFLNSVYDAAAWVDGAEPD